MSKILTVLIVLLAGCFKDDLLTTQRKDLNSNEPLKTSGYYYSEFKSGFGGRASFILYKNGIFYDQQGSGKLQRLEQIDSLILSPEFQKYNNDTKYNWGLFCVDNKNISIEKWLPGNGGGYQVALFKGKILSDTTIVIFGGITGVNYKSQLKENINMVDSFYFRHLSPKPDSTNAYIK